MTRQEMEYIHSYCRDKKHLSDTEISRQLILENRFKDSRETIRRVTSFIRTYHGLRSDQKEKNAEQLKEYLRLSKKFPDLTTRSLAVKLSLLFPISANTLHFKISNYKNYGTFSS